MNTFLWREGNSLFFAVPIYYARASSLDSSDGKWIGPGRVAEIIAKRDKEQQEAEFKAFLEKNFIPHQDGESEHISKPEIVILTVATSERCLASIEVVSSTKDLEALKLVSNVFGGTLKPAWNRDSN